MSLPTVLQGNLSLPVICSPLFIISNPDLVIAQCKAGVVGSFPALNARPAEVLDEWLQRITSELADYKAANPDATVISNMTGTTPAAWNDPTKGAEITRSQFDRGADVVFAAAGGTGVGVYQAAADAGSWPSASTPTRTTCTRARCCPPW